MENFRKTATTKIVDPSPKREKPAGMRAHGLSQLMETGGIGTQVERVARSGTSPTGHSRQLVSLITILVCISQGMQAQQQVWSW